MAGTIAAAFGAAKPRKRKVAGGRSLIGSQAGNGLADLNRAPGYQLVAIARGEGCGPDGIPDGRGRAVIVKRAGLPQFVIPPCPAESAALAAIQGAAHIAALESIAALAAHVETLAALRPYQRLGGDRDPIAALRRIAESVANVLSQHPTP